MWYIQFRTICMHFHLLNLSLHDSIALCCKNCVSLLPRLNYRVMVVYSTVGVFIADIEEHGVQLVLCQP